MLNYKFHNLSLQEYTSFYEDITHISAYPCPTSYENRNKFRQVKTSAQFYQGLRISLRISASLSYTPYNDGS